jgi:hypothetical protein
MTQLFFFIKPGVEFAAGIAASEDMQKIYVSFGVEDRQSWISTIDRDDIMSVIFGGNRSRSGNEQ